MKMNSTNSTPAASSRAIHRLARFGLGCLLAVSAAHAAPFSAGSTGARGDLVVSNTLTLDLPPDGIFHFNSLTVNVGATLSFNRNPLNTPVYLLARSNVIINGTIEVNGKGPTGSYNGGAGGPGGYDGGFAGWISGTNKSLGGSGLGPGAGLRGENATIAAPGSYGTVGRWVPSQRSGTNYGNPLLIPLVGGSGGGGIDGTLSGGGGGGGGAILIASDSLIRIPNGGTINAVGGGGAAQNGGSGGAIRLVCPRAFGNGTLQVGGGSFGGTGRIRIDSIFKTEPGDPTQELAFNIAGQATIGGNMIVFPPNLPKLDIVGIGTNTIPVGVAGPVFFTFDLDAPTNQTVTIQARNFGTNAVPIEVALIPDSGEKSTFPAVINNSANPGEVVVPVNVTPNTRVQVQAWIR